MKRTIVLLMGLFLSSASAGSADHVVVTLEGADTNFVVTVNSKKPKDLLLALSQMHSESPNRPVFLLVHEDASISRIMSILGIMYKAEMGAPRIFTYTKSRDTMVELTMGCSFLYLAQAKELTLAHGRKTCP